MIVKKRVLLIIILCTIILVAIYQFRGGGMRINANIPREKSTIKGLVEITRPYIEKYWGNRNYYVGNIDMILNENYEGEVVIYFQDDKLNREGVPNIITVHYDTKERRILRIVDQIRDTKLESNRLNVEEWHIDSDEAIRIAENTINKLEDYKYTFLHLSVNKIFSDSKEIWTINLFNESTKKEYHLEIDVYSGEVYKCYRQ